MIILRQKEFGRLVGCSKEQIKDFFTPTGKKLKKQAQQSIRKAERKAARKIAEQEQQVKFFEGGQKAKNKKLKRDYEINKAANSDVSSGFAQLSFRDNPEKFKTKEDALVHHGRVGQKTQWYGGLFGDELRNVDHVVNERGRKNTIDYGHKKGRPWRTGWEDTHDYIKKHKSKFYKKYHRYL